MSSLRNSLHRRNHKERSQLSNRARLGILEKHKDYVQRAKDFHSKQDRIKKLQEKAAARNKDEFYFGMNTSKTQGGIHSKDRGNASLPVDMVKVLKSQDENYIRAVRAAGLRKIEKLRSELMSIMGFFPPSDGDSIEGSLNDREIDTLKKAGIIPAGNTKKKKRSNTEPSTKHIVFVDDEQAARSYSTPSRRPPLDSEVDNELERIDNKSIKKGKGRQDVDPEERGSRKDIDMENTEEALKYRSDLLRELSARLTRDTSLRYAQRELEMQRLLMGKGPCKKIRGSEKVEGSNDEDENDQGWSKKKRGGKGTELQMAAYKPRVYKFLMERKR